MNQSSAFFRLLDELGIPSHTVEHEAVYTADNLAGRNISQWEFPVKNIFVEDKSKQLFLVTMHLATPPVDLKELGKRAGAAGRFSFATPQTLAGALGVLPGSVTPFAMFNDQGRRVRLVLDRRLREAKSISAHPLANTMTTTIALSDFLKLLAHSGHNPIWCAIPNKVTAKKMASGY